MNYKLITSRLILTVVRCGILIALFCFCPFNVFAQTTLIRGGTVLTVTKGIIENGDVLIQNGKIAQIGTNLSAPQGATIIDAKGKFVMPGIIDAHSHMGIDRGINEATDEVVPEARIEDVIRNDDVSLYRALAGGVTTIHTLHGSANVIGGQCETIKLRYGKSAADLVFAGAPRTVKFALGENPTRHGRNANIFPQTRMGVEQTIRQAFREAQEYTKEWDEYNAVKARKENPIPPKKDLRREALADILKGNILVHCHSYRADEILMVMRVFKEFGIKRVVFQHVLEGYKVAKELAEFGAMASTFSDWWGYKFEVYYASPYNAAIMNNYGVIVSMNSDSPELVRHLYLETAKAVKYGGVSDDAALAMITINPAKQVGIDKWVGSLEVGKDADIAIFSRHPLSSYTACEMTLVDGIVYFDRAKDKDDQRLSVDPETPVTDSFINTINDLEVDGCLQDVLFNRDSR
jgi:imidazolonepropionase-like amidohydrolase